MTNRTTGVFVSLLGALIISVDTLVIRLVGAEDAWLIVFWRGIFMFQGLLIASHIFPRIKTLLFTSVGFSSFWLTSSCYAVASIFFVTSLSNTPVANALFIISTTPLFAAILSKLFLRETTTMSTWATIGVAMGGVGLVVYDSLGSTQLLGNAFSALSALSMSGAFVISRKSGINSALAPAFGGLLSTCLVLPFLSALTFDTHQQWGWMLLEGSVVIPLSLGLIALGLRFIPAAHVSLFLQLETVLGPVWVWLILGEAPSWRTLTGGAVVVSALLVHSVLLIRSQQSAATRITLRPSLQHGLLKRR